MLEVNRLPIGSKWERFPCSDGTYRNILKNPQEIYKITYPNWDAKIKNIVDILKKIKANSEVNAKKTTDSIVKELKQTYATMQSQYCNAYLAYCANPCSIDSEKIWALERKNILKKQTQLEKLELKIQSASLKNKIERPESYSKIKEETAFKKPRMYYRKWKVTNKIPENELKEILNLVRAINDSAS
jgi:hypothetical protein